MMSVMPLTNRGASRTWRQAMPEPPRGPQVPGVVAELLPAPSGSSS